MKNEKKITDVPVSALDTREKSGSCTDEISARNLIESYQNGILERGLLLDLTKTPYFDVILRIAKYDNIHYRLDIDIAIDDEVDLSSACREDIGDRVADYLKERGFFDDLDINPDLVDWFYVLINGSDK